jgi:excisionase family DNA binding protein
MALMTASELARVLNVSRARVGQYVTEGKLNGCFLGDGRARRFDLDKVAAALGRGLHPGQMLGNGAQTRKAIADLATPAPTMYRPVRITPAPSLGDGGEAGQPEGRGEGRGDDSEAAKYETARTAKAEEEVRKLRRQNAEAEGQFVLASEVERATARMLAQEVAEFEAMLRTSARAVADKLGLDAKAVRAIFMETWRDHRSSRATALDVQAAQADLTDDELAGDI